MAVIIRADRYSGGTIEFVPDEVLTMTSPVRCTRCGAVYDLGHVTVTHRYADCSMWRTPCCDREVDDRMWVSSPSIIRIDPSTLRRGADSTG